MPIQSTTNRPLHFNLAKSSTDLPPHSFKHRHDKISLVREWGSATAHLPTQRIRLAQALIQVLPLIIQLTLHYYMCAAIVCTWLESSVITRKSIASEKGLQKMDKGGCNLQFPHGYRQHCPPKNSQMPSHPRQHTQHHGCSSYAGRQLLP